VPRIRRYLTRPTVALMDVGWWRAAEGLPSGRDDREAIWAAVTLSFRGAGLAAPEKSADTPAAAQRRDRALRPSDARLHRPQLRRRRASGLVE